MREITIELGPSQVGAYLSSDTIVSANPRGLIVFAHGSGSSRHSPRNQSVAHFLERKGFATLLADLLSLAESADRYKTFDIELLTQRLILITDWIATEPRLSQLKIGYFGASTGAAAALRAAARTPERISAVVSRGGRPDLAEADLPSVEAPTLLLVGENDLGVIELNQRALEGIRCEKKLSIIPGATHLFEEPGALDEVARRAAEWFTDHMGPYLSEKDTVESPTIAESNEQPDLHPRG